MRFVSPMVTTTYMSDDDKIGLLTELVNDICYDMRRQPMGYFKGCMNDLKELLKHPFEETKVTRLALDAIKSWDFTTRGYLAHRVVLLRQIIDLFQKHREDVWQVNEEDVEMPPCKIYHIKPEMYFTKHEHITTKPHKPFDSSHVEDSGDAGSKESITLDALLLRMKELSN